MAACEKCDGVCNLQDCIAHGYINDTFDHIARAGVTFKYTETGSQGLLTGKKAYIFAARGGLYHGTPLGTQTNYVRDFLRFIGIDDVEFVYAEGLAMGDAPRDAALAGPRLASWFIARE